MALIETYRIFKGRYEEEISKVSAGSVDLILTDPPYGITSIHWDKELDLQHMWEQYKRVLKPTGCCLIFGVGVFTAKLICSNLKEYKQTLVWDKNKCGSPGLAKIRPMQVTEDVVVFSQGRHTYNAQMREGKPYQRKSKDPGGYKTRCNSHGYGMKPVTEIVNTGTRYPSNILRFSRDFSAQQQVHPTQKPVPLLEWLIRTYSHEGQTVLDTFMGSGSTGVAAGNTGRYFIGIEHDEQHFLTSCERLRGCHEARSSKVL